VAVGSSIQNPLGIYQILDQLAKNKVLSLKSLPEDVVKTSQAQTWHTPRGEKNKSKEVQDLEVAGYRKDWAGAISFSYSWTIIIAKYNLEKIII
jgi:hypothetical protein